MIKISALAAVLRASCCTAAAAQRHRCVSAWLQLFLLFALAGAQVDAAINSS